MGLKKIEEILCIMKLRWGGEKKKKNKTIYQKH